MCVCVACLGSSDYIDLDEFKTTKRENGRSTSVYNTIIHTQKRCSNDHTIDKMYRSLLMNEQGGHSLGLAKKLSNWIHSLIPNHSFLACTREWNDYITL